MSLLIATRTELQKTKGTAIWYLGLIAAALIPLATLIFDFGSKEGIGLLRSDPWNVYLVSGKEFLGIVILPLFIVLACTLLPQIEYRNNTWKQVLTSPQPVHQVFISKFLTVQLLIVLFFLLYNVLMALSLVAVHYFRAGLDLWNHRLNWTALLQFNGRIYISLLAITALQFWLGLRLRNFITPIAIGFALWMMAMMLLAEFKWEPATRFPFSFPILTVFPKYAPMLPFIAWASPAYAALFLGVGYVDFKRRKLKA